MQGSETTKIVQIGERHISIQLSNGVTLVLDVEVLLDDVLEVLVLVLLVDVLEVLVLLVDVLDVEVLVV